MVAADRAINRIVNEKYPAQVETNLKKLATPEDVAEYLCEMASLIPGTFKFFARNFNGVDSYMHAQAEVSAYDGAGRKSIDEFRQFVTEAMSYPSKPLVCAFLSYTDNMPVFKVMPFVYSGGEIISIPKEIASEIHIAIKTKRVSTMKDSEEIPNYLMREINVMTYMAEILDAIAVTKGRVGDIEYVYTDPTALTREECGYKDRCPCTVCHLKFSSGQLIRKDKEQNPIVQAYAYSMADSNQQDVVAAIRSANVVAFLYAIHCLATIPNIREAREKFSSVLLAFTKSFASYYGENDFIAACFKNDAFFGKTLTMFEAEQYESGAGVLSGMRDMFKQLPEYVRKQINHIVSDIAKHSREITKIGISENVFANEKGKGEINNSYMWLNPRKGDGIYRKEDLQDIRDMLIYATRLQGSMVVVSHIDPDGKKKDAIGSVKWMNSKGIFVDWTDNFLTDYCRQPEQIAAGGVDRYEKLKLV